MSYMRHWFKDHSLSLVLILVLLLMVAGYAWLQYADWYDQQTAHHLSTATFGFVRYVAQQEILNFTADVFGALLIVIFTKWFRERGSKEG